MINERSRIHTAKFWIFVQSILGEKIKGRVVWINHTQPVIQQEIEIDEPSTEP